MDEEKNNNSFESKSYFDKFDSLEESIIQIPDEIQKKYELLEKIYKEMVNNKQTKKAYVNYL